MFNPGTYHRPQTLEEAMKLAANSDIALAGGALAFGKLELPHQSFVDLQDVPELKAIQPYNGGLYVGGAVTLQQIVDSSLVPDVLKRSLTRAIPLNLRNGTSVGESLMVKDPPREWLAALVALDASVEHTFPWQTDKFVSQDFWDHTAEEFIHIVQGQPRFRGLLTRIRIPTLSERTALGTAFVARTPADEPIVNAAVRVRLSEDGTVVQAVTAIGGASDLPVLRLSLSSLEGNPLDEANIASAVKSVAARVEPIADFRGSAEYRREMARLLVQRALLECREQLLS